MADRHALVVGKVDMLGEGVVVQGISVKECEER